MSALEISALDVAYERQQVLDQIDLSVASGEIVALLGPSGCGKTTLLRAVAGLVAPDSGSIALAGSDLEGQPTHERDMGLMFQDHALFPHLSVGQNVAFGLEMAKTKQAVSAQRVAESLSLVGLVDFGSRRVQELSGGEAQRVALARALAPRPQLLMLDEPLGSLDRSLREELAVELRTVLKSLEMTALHVTHDQAEAFTVADRVAVMAEGRIAAVGPPEALWRNPPSAFVARFLGHPNVVARPDINGGDHTLVPISAISLLSATDQVPPLGHTVTATVLRSEFVEGRWKVTTAGPDPLTFFSAERPGADASVRLVIDQTQIRSVSVP